MTTPPAPTPDELDRILALAKAATPGKWTVSGPGQRTRPLASFFVDGSMSEILLLVAECGSQADATYLAALSPDVVERLVAAARMAAEANRLRTLVILLRGALEYAAASQPLNEFTASSMPAIAQATEEINSWRLT